jgi:hypothetical protein
MPWHVLYITDGTGEVIAARLGEVIDELAVRGLTVVSVTTDNAKAEIKTVNILKV